MCESSSLAGRESIELQILSASALAAAMGAQSRPAGYALDRLMHEGLTRHDAIHAIGSALVGLIFDLMIGKGNVSFDNAKYGRELAALTAASWRSQKD
jgi:hypothetical protein